DKGFDNPSLLSVIRSSKVEIAVVDKDLDNVLIYNDLQLEKLGPRFGIHRGRYRSDRWSTEDGARPLRCCIVIAVYRCGKFSKEIIVHEFISKHVQTKRRISFLKLCDDVYRISTDIHLDRFAALQNLILFTLAIF